MLSLLIIILLHIPFLFVSFPISFLSFPFFPECAVGTMATILATTRLSLRSHSSLLIGFVTYYSGRRLPTSETIATFSRRMRKRRAKVSACLKLITQMREDASSINAPISLSIVAPKSEQFKWFELSNPPIIIRKL